MHAHDFFLVLLAVLLTARIFAEVASRAGIPSVLGELFAGILLGPSLLGWVEPVDAIRLMAEIGIILLLFEVGLGTDPSQLVRAGFKSMIVALAGFGAPFLLGFAVGYWVYDLPLLTSLFVGGTLTATSIGITARVLEDLHRQHSAEGQIILGAAIIDDVLGVILLALLYEFSQSGGVSIGNTSKVVLFIGAFFLLAPIAAKLMSTVVRRLSVATQIPGLIPTAIFSLVLAFAWSAHSLGAPELLGGFAAGLALSRRFFLPFGSALHADEIFARIVEMEMRPVIHLFTPIFFVMVGLSLNLRAIDWSSPFIWTFSGALVAVAFIGKIFGALLIHEPWRKRWIVGTAMVPRGEVGLIFAELGREGNIISNEVYAGLIIAIAITTFVPPILMKELYGKRPETVEP